MTPKEHAAYLLVIFMGVTGGQKQESIKAACAAVDIILQNLKPKDPDELFADELIGNQFYWRDVKQEIQKW